MSSPRPLPASVVDLLEGGVSMLIATRDAQLRPAAARGFGAQVSADRTVVSVFFPQATGARMKANLDDNGQIAVGVNRPFDNLSLQMKGVCSEVRAARDDEREVPRGYLAAYVEQLYLVGLPRSMVRRAHIWPAYVATFTVTDLFVQTPGPDAGKRLEGE